MNKLINEISSIVSQYGVDIVTEERFVNILKDLYPDRDHPEKFDILKSIVTDGVSADMLVHCNAKTAETFITDYSNLLSRKYDYDAKDITQVLGCLGIGCKCITIDEYKAASKPKESTPTPQKPQPVKPKGKKRFANTLYLLLGYLGFFVTPLVMLWHHTGGSLFITLFLVLVVHAVTILPCAIGLYKSRPNFFLGGLFSGIMLCLTVCVFYNSFEYSRDLMDFWGLQSDYNSPYFFTEIFLTAVIILYVAGAGIGSEIAGIDTSDVWGSIVAGSQARFDDLSAIWKSLTNLRFDLGLLLSITICILLYYAVKTIPVSCSFLNNSVIELKENRKQQNIELSFMDFKLGSSIDSCTNIISKSYKYQYSNEDQFFDHIRFSESKGIPSLCVNGQYYTEFVDSVIECSSVLDNFPILVKLYSNKNKVFAIEYLTHQDIGDLKDSYKSKYGQYEFFTNMAKEFFKQKAVTYFNFNDRYYWIYKNCLIELSANEWHSGEKCQDVVYLSREFDSLLEKEAKKKEAEEKKKEIEQKKKNELQQKAEQEAEEKRIEEELKQKEKAHQEAIDEI